MTPETALAPVPAPSDLPEAPLDIIVALSPEELPAAQAQLVTWCDRQIDALHAEFDELEEHRLLAVSNGWKLTSIRNTVYRAEQRLRYYRNIKAALEAGYLIVPNMPVDLLAIRVAQDGPTWRTRKAISSQWKPQRFDVPAELLPHGVGRYVDEGVPPLDVSYRKPDGKGGTEQVTKYRPSGSYVEPDFPLRAVKPAVLQATQRAMALKLFDEIGTVRQDASARGKDPIMVGRVRTDHSRGKIATFFLAWWLDPRDL